MIALYIIVILTTAELVRINYPIFNSWFSNDKKSKNFFNNIKSMTDRDMRDFVKFHIFSSKCINKMLLIVKDDVNRIPSDILEYALTTQDLTKENLDLLFSKEIIIDEKIVINTLCQKMNQLTDQNILDIFEKYKENEIVIKLLFATQHRSKILNKWADFNLYYPKYQKEQKHLKNEFWLNRISPSTFYISNRKILLFTIALCFSIILSSIIGWIIVVSTTTCVPNTCPYAEIFFSIIIPIWFIMFIISLFVSRYFLEGIAHKYFERFRLNVVNS